MASINSWNINYNTNIVSVTFDANINVINTSAFNIILNYFNSNLDPIPLSNSIVYGLGTSSISLQLDQDQVITLTNYATVPLTISDYFLNVPAANSTSPNLSANVSLAPTSVIEKTTSLTLLRYNYIVNSSSNSQLALQFADILNIEAQDPTAITLSNLTSGNSYTLTGGTVTNPTSYVAVVTLNSTDRAALATAGIAQSEESTYLQLLTTTGFEDAWNNFNQLVLTPMPVNQYLTTKPTYQGQDLGYVRQPLSRIFLLGGSEGQYIQTDGEGNLTFTSPDEYSDFKVAQYLPTYTGNLTTNNIVTTGNISANYYLGNGAFLTGITASAIVGSYSNANVANYLPINTSNVAANYFLGNGALLSGIALAQQVYGNSNVANYLPTYTGNLQSVTGNIAAGNATFYGNINGNTGTFTGNVTSQANIQANTFVAAGAGNLIISSTNNINLNPVGAVVTTANVSANYYIGNGALLSGIALAQQVYGNSNVATYLPTYTGNLQSVTGNIGSNNATLRGNVNGQTANFTGNVTAQYFFGNGSQLTGIDTSRIQNGTSNVVVALDGNVTVNVAGGLNSVFTPQGITTQGNVTATYFNGNGRFLTGLPAQYSNANVQDYLPTYTGNLINVTGNIASGNANLNGNVYGNLIGNSYGNLTGNLLGNVIGSAITVTGNISAGGVLTNNLYYANGVQWDLQNPAGSNTQVQYNDGNGNFGASSTFTFDRATNTLSVTNLSASVAGNITGATATFTANITGGNLITDGNATAGYFLGNGALLSGIATAQQVYGNANVATYLPTYTGNLQSVTGNIGSNNATLRGNVNGVSVTATGNISAGNLLTNNLYYANGVQWDLQNPAGSNTQVQYNDGNGNFGASSTFTWDRATNTLNATNIVGNVAGNLTGTTATFTGNVNAGNVNSTFYGPLTGNVTGNIFGNLIGNSYGLHTGNVTGTTATFTGNVDAGNVNAALFGTLTGNVVGNVAGNISGTTGTFLGNVNATTLNVTANAVFGGNVALNNLSAGYGTYTGNVSAQNFIGNVSGTNINLTGNVIAGGNISSNNLAATNFVTAGGNIQAGGNLVAGSNLVVTGYTTIGANTVIQGNLQVVGNIDALQYTDLEIGNLNIILAANATTPSQANGAGIIANGAYASILYNSIPNVWISTHGIQAPSFTTPGTVTANLFVGNIQGNVIGNFTINAGANREILFNNQGNVAANAGLQFDYDTQVLTVASNITAGNVNSRFYGPLTGNVAGNVTGNLIGNSYGLHTGNVIGSVTGNISGTTATFTGNVSAGNVSSIFYGPLTGDVAGNVTGNLIGNSYGNLTGNVSGTTATFTANVSANAFTTSGSGNLNIVSSTGNIVLSPTGSVITAANVSANYYLGNGRFLTGLATTDQIYGNSNVANYLPAYTGNLINVTGNVASGNANFNGNVYGNITGNLIGNSYGNLTGNLLGNVIGSAITLTGNISAGGVLTNNIYYANGVRWDLQDPAGSNTQVQYNDGNGNFGASATFTFDRATNTLSATNITGTTGTYSGNVTATGNISANYYLGNGAFLTGITASAIVGSYSNANVANYLPTYTGNLQSLTGNVITTANVSAGYLLGNGAFITGLPAQYSNANVANYLPTYTGNLVSLTGNVTTTANISANYILGNGAFITGLPSQYSNANVANYLPVYTGNISAGNVTVTSNVSSNTFVGAGNGNLVITSTSNINLNPVGAVVTTANVSANYFLGNGYYLTGLLTSNQLYSNSNVAAYLPTYTGNLISLTGNVITTANVSANYILANGAFLTGLPASYSNANVANYLPTYTGNLASLTGNVTTTGNVSANYYIGNGALLTGITASAIIGSYSNANVANYLPTYSGNLQSVIGNVAAGNATFNGNVVGNTGTFTGNVNANIVNATGTGNLVLTSDSTLFLQPSAGNVVYANSNIITTGYYIGNGRALTGISSISTGLISVATTSTNITISGIVVANSNITSAGNVQAVNIIANSNVVTTGIVATGNITTAGAVIVVGNITTTANVSAAANVSANYYAGNGRFLTGLLTTDQLYSNANVANYLPLYSGNISANNIATGNGLSANTIATIGTGNFIISSSSNINLNPTSGVTVTGNVTATAIQANYILGAGSNREILFNDGTAIKSNAGLTYEKVSKVLTVNGNVAANYFIGNGAFLTGILTTGNGAGQDISGFLYTFLPTYTGNLSANIINANVGNYSGPISTLSSITASNNIVTSANVSGAYFLGNIVGTTANFAGNIAAGNIQTTQLIANTVLALRSITAFGNVNVLSTLTVAGNTVINGNLRVIGNVTYIDVENLNVTDKNITIANGAATPSDANGGGIYIDGANANFYYDYLSNSMILSHPFTSNGNITATNYYFGNGAYLTGVSNYSNANIAAYLPSYTGNLSPGNLLVTNLLHPNGQPWQAVDFSGYYSNSNVQRYLPTYSGNLINVTGNVGQGSNVTFFLGDLYGNSYGILFGNVVGQSLIGNLTGNVVGNVVGNVTGNLIGNSYGLHTGNILGEIGQFSNSIFSLGNIQTLANLQANYFLGNGAFITGLPAQYGNANVANYLPTYTGNISANNISTGNIVSGNIDAGNINLTGNIVGNAAAFSLINTTDIVGVNVIATTGAFNTVNIGLSAVVANANGNVYATNFIGNIVGNIIGNIASPGSNTQVLFNNNGVISGNSGLTYNYASNVLAVSGNVTANNTISNNVSKVGNVSMVYNSGLNSLDFIFG